MIITITVISIIVITILVWAVNKILTTKICPICAGVFLTWLWFLIGMKLNLLSIIDYQLITAVIMGGTVVGLMSKLEKQIETKFILIWKTIFVVSGFTAVYNLLFADWALFLAGVIAAVACIFIFKVSKINKGSIKPQRTKELEKQMKNCC